MSITSTPYSAVPEKELYRILSHAISGAEGTHRTERIDGLEELLKRVKIGSIQNVSEAMQILIRLARIQGDSEPEFFLITESMKTLINKHEEFHSQLLNGLKKYEDKIFLCYSKVILSLHREKQKQGIKYLVNFLTTRHDLQGIGIKEVNECLLSLGRESEDLSSEIVKEAAPFLKSNPEKWCAIAFSARLCSRFANDKLLPDMLDVLERSIRGYFRDHHIDIEREVCRFLERVKDPQAIPVLMSLLEMRFREGHNARIRSAMASILDTHQSRVDDVLDILYDQSDRDLINATLKTLEEMDKPVDAGKLLGKIRPSWWKEFKFSPAILQKLLVKGGKNSKTPLFDLLRQNKRYDFALECLKEIGASRDEITAIFPKPPIMQLYRFFFKPRESLQNLDQIWADKGHLSDNMEGQTQRLEHLLLNIFSSLNFVTMNLAPLGIKGVDLVCFYPETLDLFIIGCTTGIMKNDLQTMNATITKMEAEIPEILKKCSITPIVVSSEMATISQADFQYAAQNRIVILQRNNIDDMLEMLNTNRQSSEMIRYIKNQFRPTGLPVSY